MASIMAKVTNFIDHDVSIRRGLTRGFINTRALAKYLQKTLELNVGLDAVISAIRRYTATDEHKTEAKKRYHNIAAAKITSRTKMCSILLKKDAKARSGIAALYAKIDFSKGDVLRTLESNQHIKMIIDESNLTLAQSLVGDHTLLIKKDLGEISLLYDDADALPGTFAAVSSEIALNNISLQDALICGAEHIIILHQDDVVRTVQVLDSIRTWAENTKQQSY